MCSRQRLPSGRTNGGSTTTVLPPRSQRTLRLALIPEDGSTNGTSRDVAPTRNISTLLEEREMSRKMSLPSSRLSTQRDDVNELYSSRPWAAPSVQVLTSQLGKNREAHALVIEGPRGDVLTAVGCDKDNALANVVLSRANETPMKNESDNFLSCNAGNTPHVITGASRSRNKGNHRLFGVVYEHRDCFGKPMFIGHTSGVPEKRFVEDAAKHQPVRNLLTYEQGRSDVVWAGTATPSSIGGEDTMRDITQRIVDQRAKEQHLNKLRGPKPYSRHGY